MSPAAKYTLGRLGLFVVAFLALLPVSGLHILIRAMLALVVSAVAGLFLLRGWRDETARQLAGIAERRRMERERLRSALAGDEAAAAAGDRAGPGAGAGPGDAAPPEAAPGDRAEPVVGPSDRDATQGGGEPTPRMGSEGV